MQIVSHRGYWKEKSDQNTVQSFQRAFALGFGIETDLRDFMGDLVIAHDLPKRKPPTFVELLEVHMGIGEFENRPLALNIKCDGLQHLVKEILEKYAIKNYFVFDMSVPDMLLWSKAGLRFFTRQSELETAPSLYHEASGVWMDSFFGDWIEEKEIEVHMQNGKQVCVVSPELHRRSHRGFWSYLKRMRVSNPHELMLCTDFPDEAKEYFIG